MPEDRSRPEGFIARVVGLFLFSRLPFILIVLSLSLGIAAIQVTPREEEPQIVVPLADVFIQAPGSSPAEIEKLVATPLERLLWQIDGVEYVYSVAHQDMAVVTVRFYVGEDREASLVKLHNKITMNIDRVPPIVGGWVIKPVEIDDVPIVNLTLYAQEYDDHQLHRIGSEVLSRLSEVKNTSRTQIVGGRKREIRVELLPEKMSGMGISMLEVQQALKGSDVSVTAGSFSRFNREISVTSNAFLTSAREISALMVGVHKDRPVYLRDIAMVIDGPEEPHSYSRISFSNAMASQKDLKNRPQSYAAVTLSLAKKKGTNAVSVARNVLKRMEQLKTEMLPAGVEVAVTRNYGQTAQEKVDGLLGSLGFAILTVVILLVFSLGWREALIVAVAVPISFSLALFVNFLLGYTINRVTLFALILSLGLVVDDPITNVDNIQRHIFRGRLKPLKATLFAVDEVLPPVIMSTLAIIACFAPLFFITGMMGPYMAPMAANVPLTVIFSTVCALAIVPKMTYVLLKGRRHPAEAPVADSASHGQKGFLAAFYRGMMSPLLNFRSARFFLFLVIGVLFVVSLGLAAFRQVPLKMLPFDNKNEFQIVLDMPEGTPLEETDRVVRSFEHYLKTVAEATSIVSYVGTSSPIDFNGLVRHYYLRSGGHMADIRVNLVEKNLREQQSHEIVLRLRNDLEAIARQNGANMKIVEVPPGPPVVSTLVAEVYGSPDSDYGELIKTAADIKMLMADEPFVVDIDDTVEADRQKLDFIIDKEKAALHGVSSAAVNQTLYAAITGTTPATVHLPGERQPLLIRVVLPLAERSSIAGLLQIPIKTATGKMVPLAEIVRVEAHAQEQPIYHKNLERVVYVMAEMAGRAPAEAVLDMQARLKKDPPPKNIRIRWAGEGEWEITLRVFRDLGIAFGAALVGIYILLIGQTGSFFMPLLIMMAIPLTLLGVMPGFYLLNLFSGGMVGGYHNPVFFTATSMIGMIALGGIVIRNSLILIEFIQDSVQKGAVFKEAILQSGAIRMRPILLTAATTALGAWPITLDPVFSGLAWALIFGIFASTVFTLIIVPVTYYSLYENKPIEKIVTK